MRSLRTGLTRRLLAPGRLARGVVCIASALVATGTPATAAAPASTSAGSSASSSASSSATTPATTTATSHPYFPLAVGNRWAYRCSTEGTPTAGKVLQIRQQLQHGGRPYFRAELRVGSDALPLVQYLSVDADGNLRRALAAPSAGAAAGAASAAGGGGDHASRNSDVLLAANTTAGSPHGGWVSAGVERLPLPALPRAQALRIETFSLDSPTLPASQRAAWRARYYVRGVGPVADADGLGGHCDLTSYRLARPAVIR